jgi:hypothetical protein
MTWDGIVAGDYGQVGKLTLKDIDTDSGANISGYSNTIQVILTDPDGNAATKTAAFDSDGSDGIIKYTLANGDIDESGNWSVRGKVASGTAVLTSSQHTFYVLP